MIFFVSVVALSALVAYLRGGRLGNVQLRLLWLPPLALALQLPALWLTEPPVKLALLVLSHAAGFAFLAANWESPGLRILLIGSVLNFAAIAANGGKIPVDPDALRLVGLDPAELAGGGIKHSLLTPESRLAFLGDVIPLPFIGRVSSIGDIFILLGAFLAVQELMPRKSQAATGTGGRVPDPQP